MEALWRHGPLAVGVDASFDDFLFYSEGVYRNKHCALKPANLDHAVILVGYGHDDDAGPFWIIKNSWSKLWGQDGYIRVHRGGNECVAVEVAQQIQTTHAQPSICVCVPACGARPRSLCTPLANPRCLPACLPGLACFHCLACSCGIASDAAFAEVSPQDVVPGAREGAMQLVVEASSRRAAGARAQTA